MQFKTLKTLTMMAWNKRMCMRETTADRTEDTEQANIVD